MPTKIAPDLLALQRLYAWEKEAPTRVALTQPMGDGSVRDFTWSELAGEVRRMAGHLQSIGIQPGDKVAILSKNCAWWLMSDLAIWMAGGVSVPLYPTLAPDTISHILKHSEARACFIGKLDGWEAMAPGVPADLPCISYALSPDSARKAYPLWDTLCKAAKPITGQPVRGGEDLATLIYTSGTTGMPKGVMHNFNNFAWALDAGIRRLPMGKDDRMLSYLPLAHVVERVLVEHGWLRTGMHVFFADSLDTFTTDMQRARPTIFFSVPRLWVKFQQAIQHKMPEHKLQRLLGLPLIGGLVRRKIQKTLGLDQARICAGGAAPMPLALLQWYSKLGIAINEGYGMTENLAVSHITVPGKNQQGSVGPAYEGVLDRIDPESGEIQMKSPAVMQGYYKAPEQTRDTFTADGWLRTGDKGRIDSDKCLHITGRVKDLFKTGKGKYVAPAPIEDKLGGHEAVEACVVTGANLGQPLGIVMLNPEAAAGTKSAEGRKALEQSLTQHLAKVNATLDPHEQLQCIVVSTTPWTVENDIITPTFKVKRNRIEDLYAAKFNEWEESRKKVLWA